MKTIHVLMMMTTAAALLFFTIVRHPIRFAKSVWPWGWGRRTIVLLVMQSLDNAISFRAKSRSVVRSSSCSSVSPCVIKGPSNFACFRQRTKCG